MRTFDSLVVYPENEDDKSISAKPFSALLADQKVWLIGTDSDVINTKDPVIVIGTINYYLDLKQIPSELIHLIWEYCTKNVLLLCTVTAIRGDAMLTLAQNECMESENKLLINLKNYIRHNYCKDIRQKVKFGDFISFIDGLILDERNPNKRILALGFLENAIDKLEEYIAHYPFPNIMLAKPYCDFRDLLRKIANEAAVILQIQSPDLKRCFALYKAYSVDANGPKSKPALQ